MADGTCNVGDCPEWIHCKGMCRPHYMRNYRYGDPLGGGPFGKYVPATPENFEKRVNRFGPLVPDHPELGPCWLWLGRLDIGGYGLFGSQGRKSVRVHRKSWEEATGRSAEGLELDHVCHSLDMTCAGGKCIHRRCLNPQHLEPVGHRENQLRGVRGRRMTHCKRGHLIETTGWRRNGLPRRQCEVCRAENRKAIQMVASESRSELSDALTATPEVLAELARVYLDAVRVGDAPRRAVVRRFGRSPNTLSDWIRKARDAGLLPPVALRPDDRRRRAA